MPGKEGTGLKLAAQTTRHESGHMRRPHTEEARLLSFLERFPEYIKTLRLAAVFEENAGSPVQGWRWHDVETHPTKLIRLVTDGIARVSLKTRGATFYLLRDKEAVKRIVEQTAVSEDPSA